MGGITDTSFDNIKGKEIVIHPIGKDSVTPAGYDLRAGLILVLSHDNVQEKKDPKGNIIHVIPPHTSVLIRTKEFVWLSQNIIATIHARGSLAAKGLFINSTTVDPNWGGQMTCLLHNINDYKVELVENMRFATMVMSTVDKPTSTGPASNPTDVTKKYLERYGSEFSDKVANYLSSKEIVDLHNDFNEMVGKACEPNFRDRLILLLSNAFKKISKFIGANVLLVIFILSLLCVLLLMFIAIYPSTLVSLGIVKNLSDFSFARIMLFAVGATCIASISGLMWINQTGKQAA